MNNGNGDVSMAAIAMRPLFIPLFIFLFIIIVSMVVIVLGAIFPGVKKYFNITTTPSDDYMQIT